jgi:hypothetical protein
MRDSCVVRFADAVERGSADAAVRGFADAVERGFADAAVLRLVVADARLAAGLADAVERLAGVDSLAGVDRLAVDLGCGIDSLSL